MREAMSNETLREWIEKAQFTVTSPAHAPHVNEPIQVVTVEGLLAALTSGDGTPRPWVSEAALNKIAPFLEGVENAHLRATHIVSALASGDGSESAGLRGDEAFQAAYDIVFKCECATPYLGCHAEDTPLRCERCRGLIEKPWVLNANTHKLIKDFSAALIEKLSASEKKYGYSDHWMRNDWMDECRVKLLKHLEKGDPRDVAAYCAFLWYHTESTSDDTCRLLADSDAAFYQWFTGNFVPDISNSQHLQGAWKAALAWRDLAPTISRPPTQGSSLPPSRADLGGDRAIQFEEALRDLFGLVECGELVRDISRDGNSDYHLRMLRLVNVLKNAQTALALTEPAIAEGQQSSELVEKTSRDTEGESSHKPQGGRHDD